MNLTASRVFPSFRAHIAMRRLIYTRMFVSRPVFYNNITPHTRMFLSSPLFYSNMLTPQPFLATHHS